MGFNKDAIFKYEYNHFSDIVTVDGGHGVAMTCSVVLLRVCVWLLLFFSCWLDYVNTLLKVHSVKYRSYESCYCYFALWLLVH